MSIDPLILSLGGVACLLLGVGLALLLTRGRSGPGPLAHMLEALAAEQSRLDRTLREELSLNRSESGTAARGLSEMLERRFDSLGTGLDARYEKLVGETRLRLDEIRKTVDENLRGTLEKRLGESFKLVSDRLEQVHRGLGEMQSLASGVGDLKRVLTNVKTRGIWGEMQLEALLSQVLTPEQYLPNVICRDGSADRVEFVIRMPGRDEESEVWLPIDAKFPREDYERLMDASENADAAGVELASRALDTRLRQSARDIRDKYLCPPRTTDFAIMFLPSESLYAEALRRPGLIDALQRDYRVVPAGPTTLAALLNSLQMGFRTLAIEKRSSEVWQLLGAVKVEFGRYGEILDKVQRKLTEASQQIDQVAVRRRAVDRKLRSVQSLDPVSADLLIGPPEGFDERE